MHSIDRAVLVRPAGSLRDPVRLFPGSAVERSDWLALTPLERRRLVVRARTDAVGIDVDGVVSHRSAAALWGLPDFDRDDGRLHLIDVRRQKTHCGPGVVRHVGTLGRDDVVRLDGITVTSLLRTVVDVIRSVSFVHAVIVLDHVLRLGRLTKPQLLDALAPLRGLRGSSRAIDAVRFADPLAESPGESASRVQVRELRLPTPVLQHEFDTPNGQYRVDFWWPEHGIVGEFDGRVKYDDAETLWREKLREDALRRHASVHGVARWTMSEAVDPAKLATVLIAAGLPVLRAAPRRPPAPRG
jgi:hypothetical protein